MLNRNSFANHKPKCVGASFVLDLFVSFFDQAKNEKNDLLTENRLFHPLTNIYQDSGKKAVLQTDCKEFENTALCAGKERFKLCALKKKTCVDGRGLKIARAKSFVCFYANILLSD